MDWVSTLLIIFFGLVALMMTGMPVAFAFMVVNVIGIIYYWGGPGLEQLILSIFESLTYFALLPVPLFILMGEVLLHSGMGTHMLDALDKALGRLPGRLGVIAVAGGVVIGVLSGNAWASTAMLGSVLQPEMRQRGYKKPLVLGPILGSGVLAPIIPPSGLAVVLASLAGISVGGLLIAGLIPGVIIGLLFALYIIGRAILRPDLAPSYLLEPLPLSKRFIPVLKYVVPLGTIVFSVIGLMLLGICTPSEAAAFGAMTTTLMAAVYRSLTWKVLRTSLTSTVKMTGMIFLIMCGSAAFSQILAYSGASKGMVDLAVNLAVPPIVILIMMLFVTFIMGMFIEQMCILMITLPIFMPIVTKMGWDPIWWGLMMLINMALANLSPPFGISLFVMKAISPPDVTMGDVYKACIPFLLIGLLGIILAMIFPPLATWLPKYL